VTAGDFDHDGDLDLTVANYFGKSTVDVLLGNGDGTFAPAVACDASVPWGNAGGGFDIKAADINGDNNLDIVAATWAGPLFLHGNGDGTFAPGYVNTAYAESTLSGHGGVDIGDLNGDGVLDLVLSNERKQDWGNGVLAVMLGKTDGTYDDPIEFRAGERPWQGVAMVDVDGDGDLDLAAADWPNGRLVLLLNTTPAPPQPSAGDADRDGSFDFLDIVQVLQAAKYGTGEPADWSEGDWDGNGVFDRLDIVLALSAGNYVP
jgi:hypothetical protein